jgi:ATP adenylyltransferase
MAYIQAAKQQGDDAGCIFCDLPQRTTTSGRDPRPRRARVRDPELVPVQPGASDGRPFRHVGDLVELETAEFAEVDTLLVRSIRALQAETEPHGFNLGMNLGRVAGAGIPDHVHWHVVPRWNGDTNFMPVVGETRVLPELLEETYARLRPRFEE